LPPPAPVVPGPPAGPAAPPPPARTEPTRDVLASSQNPAVPVPPAAPVVAPREPTLPKVQLVNSTKVTLTYELNKVGPSGVGAVEVWLTQTDGKSWQQWVGDPDAASLKPGSPYHSMVTLPGEGVYGFYLV